MFKNAPIYWKLIVTSIRAKMEYKVTFLFLLVALLFYYLGQLGVILIILTKFKNINGWSLGEMAFLYGLLVFSQGISTLLFSSLNYFENLIIEGDFDRLLVRPLNPLLQVLASSFELSSVAHFLIGSTALYYGATRSGLEWTFQKIAFFPIALLGAVLIQGGIRLAVAAVTFWTTRNRSLVHTIVYSSKEFILYPISIYNFWVQAFLTLIFPLAFINYYPSHFFLARDSSTLLFHPLLQYGTPLAGLIVFTMAYALWKAGINHYQSVGN
ncbi:hypothetical protein MNBD_NITROSPINAE01-1012 [hydrothermal vent metagenome]|uniref:Efflux ABC transporter, permease protein n=1 Tax=hydrothermal vent metagenome TaxID=652676 RepID=A0A3B1C0N7_9ZZZZ